MNTSFAALNHSEKLSPLKLPSSRVPESGLLELHDAGTDLVYDFRREIL